MAALRSLVVPGWTRIIPGLVFCIVFAWIVMNIDHVLGKYHKADVASAAIPALQVRLAEATATGDADVIALAEKNLAVAEAGYALATDELIAKLGKAMAPSPGPKRMLLNGNEAVALGAIAAWVADWSSRGASAAAPLGVTTSARR